MVRHFTTGVHGFTEFFCLCTDDSTMPSQYRAKRKRFYIKYAVHHEIVQINWSHQTKHTFHLFSAKVDSNTMKLIVVATVFIVCYAALVAADEDCTNNLPYCGNIIDNNGTLIPGKKSNEEICIDSLDPLLDHARSF